MIDEIPETRPYNPRFSSGPCAKRPGWCLDVLSGATIGRSHRSVIGRLKLKEAISLTRTVLHIPDSYLIGIVPASDTGAYEMAMWTLLGLRPVTMLSWESFGAGWVSDVVKHLKLEDVTTLEADYGALPDLTDVNFDHDVCFTWNGTTSGVKVPNGDWIASDRAGLTLCDATSAAFAQSLDWEKLDVVTYSWQKVLGGEAAHGMLILSPRAVERLTTYTPSWPLPKIFRLTKNGRLIKEIFEGATINTPSMLCVEDYLDALKWAQRIGGLEQLINRANQNASIIERWVEKREWVDFLCKKSENRSNTSICLVISDPIILRMTLERQASFAKSLVHLLEQEKVAFDIGAHRDAPIGFRIWTGATMEAADLKALCEWLDWGFLKLKSAL